MGVRKYFILNWEGTYYTGPAAFRKLKRIYFGYLDYIKGMGKVPIIQPPGKRHWRKEIVPLYEALKKYYGLGDGTLQMISHRKARKDKRYSQILYWIDTNCAKLKTPRKETA